MSSTHSGLAQQQWLVRCLRLIDNISVTTLRKYACSPLPQILTPLSSSSIFAHDRCKRSIDAGALRFLSVLYVFETILSAILASSATSGRTAKIQRLHTIDLRIHHANDGAIGIQDTPPVPELLETLDILSGE